MTETQLPASWPRYSPARSAKKPAVARPKISRTRDGSCNPTRLTRINYVHVHQFTWTYSNPKSANAKTAASESKTSSGLECYEVMGARKIKPPQASTTTANEKKTLRQQHLAARILSITGSSVTGRVRGAAVSTRRDSPKEVSIMRDATRGLRLITCRDRSVAVSTERDSPRGVSTLREATRNLSRKRRKTFEKIMNSREMSRLRLREDATSDESGATGAGLHYQLQGCEMMSHLPIC